MAWWHNTHTEGWIEVPPSNEGRLCNCPDTTTPFYRHNDLVAGVTYYMDLHSLSYIRSNNGKSEVRFFLLSELFSSFTYPVLSPKCESYTFNPKLILPLEGLHRLYRCLLMSVSIQNSYASQFTKHFIQQHFQLLGCPSVCCLDIQLEKRRRKGSNT